uniref:Uncharacterized protein n=1 Tax=Sphaerodactylus townsendi TaxID=933632 RepID=A0ACB8FDB8_9SAUR
MKLRQSRAAHPHIVVEFPSADEKMETVSGLPEYQMNWKSSQMLMGNPQNGTQKMQLEVTTPTLQGVPLLSVKKSRRRQKTHSADFVNQAESAAVPELQMDGVHADWCQEDQRQDEFLKERGREQLSLLTPKLSRWFQFSARQFQSDAAEPRSCGPVPEKLRKAHSCEGKVRSDCNVCLTNVAWQEVPVPEADQESSKSRDSVVQDLSRDSAGLAETSKMI